MSGQKRSLPLAFKTEKVQSPCMGIFTNCFCVEAIFFMKGSPSHGSTVASGSAAIGSAADTEAPEWSMSRAAFRACKPTPLKVSRAEMMQEQKWDTHTHTHACAPFPMTCLENDPM